MEAPPVQALSLVQLPEQQLFIEIATFLDHKSLCNLGATCSSTRQQLLPHEGTLWKALHNARWSCGKQLRFAGLPSQWPRDGVKVSYETLNWRKDFIRRFELDKSVPTRVARLGRRSKRGISPVSLSLMQDGADIWDKLKVMSCDEGLYTKAEHALELINKAEVKADWITLTTIHAENATFDDALMIFSKYWQTGESLVERSSSDEIYNVINRELDVFTQENLRRIEVDPVVNPNPFHLPYMEYEFFHWGRTLSTYLRMRLAGDNLWETAQIEWRSIMNKNAYMLIYCMKTYARETIREIDYLREIMREPSLETPVRTIDGNRSISLSIRATTESMNEGIQMMLNWIDNQSNHGTIAWGS